MPREIYLTEQGLTKLKDEYLDLVKRARNEIAQRIKEAKEYGDLGENSEYIDAKDQQAFIEGRIAELEHVIKNASVIKNGRKNKTGIVEVGSVVHVKVKTGKMKFHIVGAHEADPDTGHISHESPIGQALLGKTKGEVVEVIVPAGKIKYEILAVE